MRELQENKLSDKETELLKYAWATRNGAHAWKSGTKVGCAILTESNEIVTGFNIEGLWMTSIMLK